MARIRKSYFALQELAEAWDLPQADLRYVAETGLLAVSVLIVGALVELGSYERRLCRNTICDSCLWLKLRAAGCLVEASSFVVARPVQAGMAAISPFMPTKEIIRLML